MMDDYLKMAMEMVKAQAGVRTMSADEMTTMILELSKKLSGLAVGMGPVTQIEPAGPAIDPKKSIKEKSVTCLECGKVMKVLTAKHLASHELTKAEYLEKYGMKKGTSLLAKGLSRARKEKMKSMELWKRRGTKQASEGNVVAAPKKKAGAPAKKAKAASKA
jgi:predicted transcriptional regulator